MAFKSLRPCNYPGCPRLVRSGYCDDHRRILTSPFERLSEKKTPEQKAFYSSQRWTQASRLYRAEHPLCERCHDRGIVMPAEMVHHTTPLTDLISQGLDPYNHDYLQALCNRCHMEDLRAKRKR